MFRRAILLVVASCLLSTLTATSAAQPPIRCSGGSGGDSQEIVTPEDRPETQENPAMTPYLRGRSPWVGGSALSPSPANAEENSND